MAAFKAGDRVLWHHEEATKHAEGSVIRASVAEGLTGGDHPDACHGQVGTVVGPANEPETWWTVDFEGDQRVLTSDELVRVEPPVAGEGV